MKIRPFHRLTAMLCALALLLTLSPAVLAAESPAESDNSLLSGYGFTSKNWADPTTSYLFENPQGNLTRVEYIAIQHWRTNGNEINTEWTKSIVVEDYTPDFQLISSRTIPIELDIWGGFFAGEKYNFFIFGQNNPNESDSVEVIRVVKYSKDWQRLEQASLYGADTYQPISASGVHCAEYGDVLYVRTGHEMYKSSDGLNHQSNMTFAVQESTMTIPPYESVGYVSHSFQQLILIDSENNIIAADHGDAYPRAFRLYKYAAKAGSLSLKSSDNGARSAYVDFQTFPGTTGKNSTSGMLLGLEEVTDGYVLTYIYKNNVYLAYVAKRDLTGNHGDDGTVKLTKLTDYTEGTITKAHAYGATMVSTGLSGGYVLWTEVPQYTGEGSSVPKRVFYASYSADGSIGQVHEFTEGRLSDCQPIIYQGKIVWYQTEQSIPTFYTLDASGTAAVKANSAAAATTPTAAAADGFVDVSDSAYYHDAVEWAVKAGVTAGTDATHFSPDAVCTRGQVVTFLWRASGSPEPKTQRSPFTDVSSSSPFYKAILWAYENEITTGVTATTFHPSGTCTYNHVVTFLWRAKGSPIPTTARGQDVAAAMNDPTGWACEKNLLSDEPGSIDDRFKPDSPCPRADIVTYLYRANSIGAAGSGT